MSTTAPANDEDEEGDEAEEDGTLVSAYSSCPEKTVFTERTNPDGWIATDLTVELER
jgi:hypothetical protein